MNKKTYIYILTLLLLLSFCYAEPKLTITPTSIDVTIARATEQQYLLTLNTINSTSTIYNITFSPVSYFTFPKINNITTESTLDYYFTVYTDNVVDQQYITTVSFDYYSDFTLEPITHQISITANGFQPNSLLAHKTDKIVVTNKDVVNRTFTRTDYGFDYILAPNQSKEQTLEQTGTLLFFDRFSNYGGSVETLDNLVQILTHSADYDKTLNLRLNSNLAQTTITLSMFEDNFSVRHNETRESALQIKNEGSETAYNINLQMNWTSFNMNNFNLNASESKVVLFEIKPTLTTTEESGITHNLTLTVHGDNTNTVDKQVNVFVPYTSFITVGNGTDLVAIWRAKKEFCDSYPYSIDCIMEPLVQTRNITIYQDKPVNVTFSEDEVVAIKDLLASGDLQTRTENVVKIAMDDLTNEMVVISSDVSSLAYQVEVLRNVSEQNAQLLRRREISGVVLTILTIFGLIVLTIGGLIYFVYRRRKISAQKESVF